MSECGEETFEEAVDILVGSDGSLAKIVERYGCPSAFARPATFATLVLLILEQQVSLDSARAAFDRLDDASGGVTPEGLLGLDGVALRSIGFSAQKSRYSRALADRVVDRSLDLAGLIDMPSDEVRAKLIDVPGIGPWTADVFLMSCLGRSDIWPIGDRALQVGAGEALDLSTPPTSAELDTIGDRWRPRRTAAAHVLWHGYLRSRGRVVPEGRPSP